jgi:ABC-type multidrug transport system fused ATPase/permease subunit
VNFQLEAGSRTALVGGIGSGKSLLLDVLYGLREPRQGYVEVDGRDLREIRLGDLRSQVALVREPQIFEGTVIENLQLGDAGMTLDQARTALSQVGLLDRVMNLPEGLQTRLSTGGPPLSPGRRVQLELARGLAHQPRLLILDECLDWLDDLDERDALLDFLFDPRRGWTLIVATRSQEILDRCSRILEIRKSSVVEVRG